MVMKSEGVREAGEQTTYHFARFLDGMGADEGTRRRSIRDGVFQIREIIPIHDIKRMTNPHERNRYISGDKNLTTKKASASKAVYSALAFLAQDWEIAMSNSHIKEHGSNLCTDWRKKQYKGYGLKYRSLPRRPLGNRAIMRQSPVHLSPAHDSREGSGWGATYYDAPDETSFITPFHSRISVEALERLVLSQSHNSYYYSTSRKFEDCKHRLYELFRFIPYIVSNQISVMTYDGEEVRLTKKVNESVRSTKATQKLASALVLDLEALKKLWDENGERWKAYADKTYLDAKKKKLCTDLNSLCGVGYNYWGEITQEMEDKLEKYQRLGPPLSNDMMLNWMFREPSMMWKFIGGLTQYDKKGVMYDSEEFDATRTFLLDGEEICERQRKYPDRYVPSEGIDLGPPHSEFHDLLKQRGEYFGWCVREAADHNGDGCLSSEDAGKPCLTDPGADHSQRGAWVEVYSNIEERWVRQPVTQYAIDKAREYCIEMGLEYKYVDIGSIKSDWKTYINTLYRYQDMQQELFDTIEHIFGLGLVKTKVRRPLHNNPGLSNPYLESEHYSIVVNANLRGSHYYKMLEEKEKRGRAE